ncbi:hypothetical protein DDB_G0286583 [Dictyostelium discoideum AX4]|uniref:Leucine-rich repeat-containing protein n=1 Tax=Dictyostelium discoideum TaxID=44689 RepID=Q54LL7_DICDI|nr:hypothetical protein DDB_G0286583 [Dictyostelium discoideum AX4]EAL64047.1 hypothetical protein DDB_G0286583 [Dictyostelium discoideum AX4]|eukprot:XP_637544.1 hypothetical protein DDB_G0286583 [Dictyostelium discoideum AX4]
MDQLAELRKQRHLEYLQKKEKEDAERLELERIQIENAEALRLLNPNNENLEDEITATTTTTTTTTTMTNNDIEFNEEEEEEENEEEEVEEEEVEEEEEEENDIEEEEPNFNGPPLPQPPVYQPIFKPHATNHHYGHYNNNNQPYFPPVFNPNLFGGGGHHGPNHNIFNHGGIHNNAGPGYLLNSDNNNNNNNYNNPFTLSNNNNNNNSPPQSTEPTTKEEKRSAFLNSIESRYNKSPELVSVNNEIDKQKRKIIHRIPKDYSVKKLVDLCLAKMSIDLTLFQSQLKLMSGELIQRLIELMVSSNRLTRKKMDQIVASGARIYSLDLSHQFAVVNNDFLLNCFKYMAELSNVYFRNCENLNDIGLQIFRQPNFEKNLKTLDLRDNRITDVGIRNLKGLLNLEELYLGSTGCTDIGLALLCNLLKLKTLDVSKCNITDSSMDIICRFTELKFLYLSGTQVTDKGINTISKLPNLIQLYVSNCLRITNQSLFFLAYLGKTLKLLDIFQTKIGLNGFIQLRMFKQLQFLVLPGRDSINDATIGHLNSLSNLRKLDLSDYRNISDLSPLTNLQSLTELLLSNTKISDNSIINSIKTMDSLEVLSLNKTEVTTEGVSQLVNLNLTSLSLSSTKIDGKSLYYLGQMKSLQKLDISFNDITDNSMDYLKPIADTLSHIDLRGTDTFRSLHMFNEKIVRPPVKNIIKSPNNNEEDGDNNDDDDDDENEPLW